MIRPGPLSIRARSATLRPFLSFPSAKGCEVQRTATLQHERTFCLFSGPPCLTWQSLSKLRLLQDLFKQNHIYAFAGIDRPL
jgi:hypothetical protein